MTRKYDTAMPLKVPRLVKKMPLHASTAKGLLAWSAGGRVLGVLPVLLMLWLAVAWATQELPG